MKHIFAIGFKLALICAVAAVALSLINMITEPRIEAYKEQKLREALEAVSAGYSAGEQQSSDNPDIAYIFPLYAEDNTEAGYVLRLRAAGYGGEMWILASYRNDGSVISARLLENTETPGLGKKAEDPEYMKMFENTGTEGEPIPVRKGDLPPPDAEAVSGASVTFTGIAKALEAGSAYVKSELNGGSYAE